MNESSKCKENKCVYGTDELKTKNTCFQGDVTLQKWQNGAKHEAAELLASHQNVLPAKETPLKMLDGVQFYLDHNGEPVCLGSGAFGSVYVVVHGGQLRALKVFSSCIILMLFFNFHLDVCLSTGVPRIVTQVPRTVT